MTKVKAWLRACARRLTWRNAKWFLKVNALGWAFQLTAAGVLVLCGTCELTALMSAKAANWVYFLQQCRSKLKGE